MKTTTRYYYDTEFLEGTQKETIFGISARKVNYIYAGALLFVGLLLLCWDYFYPKAILFGDKESMWGFRLSSISYYFLFAGLFYLWNGKKDRWTTLPTIDFISIGIVDENGRELYLISKDFNLKEAWERYDVKEVVPNHPKGSRTEKVYWIRENVLRPIFDELCKQDRTYDDGFLTLKVIDEFTYKNMKYLINKYGKTNSEIAKDIERFCKVLNPITPADKPLYQNIELYGYFSAYDHVALSWLFGKMINLPEGFPKHTIDLKQMLDEKAKDKSLNCFETTNTQGRSPEWWIENFKQKMSYPKQTNEHNALSDAIWNRDLHNFIKSL